MHPKIFRSTFVLPGMEIIDVADDGTVIRLSVRSSSAVSRCPGCGSPSRRVHSRYRRRLMDLPAAGRTAQLTLLARRFFCDAVLCGRRVFTERFDPTILTPRARRTARLDKIIHHLGLALGGRPAAAMAQRLMMPVSNDTLLRVVRRQGSPKFVPPTVIGIDDWAWRRNQRYGTLICDLERRRTIALLPDREPATVQAWLEGQPQVSTVARDRGGGYAIATAKALPDATQVADRWHLMENASRAFLDAVRKSMKQIRVAVGATTIDPALLTAAEKLQYDGYVRREETNAAIQRLSKEGMSIREIVRRTGHSRGLVRKILRGQRSDIFRTRESSLEVHLPWLDQQWAAGHHNGADLWRRLQQQGFRGSLRVVAEWATRRRRADQMGAEALSRTPSARTIARFMTLGRDALTKAETVLVAAIEGSIPTLVDTRNVVADFQGMIRRKSLADLDPWLERAKGGLVASFANGINKDRAAVAAAITSPWSNGQTEGQITKLKLVKRQMYGRGKLDLLQARVIGVG
ncbi:ISL3 family transposase [Nitrospirillum sp. BR 11828]|uniref:ISL3 family transposase n=1 Tax=Nitrospirillum sp. BR 11828 TaxID=3104325 RepID=UPI002ACA03E6|nr:ISL3 family transposase [Nitrospirillum sp. BR 11828]MDZ5650598.1 ISL3 family transposase [Nitrospirillum sp. BR 11828]